MTISFKSAGVSVRVQNLTGPTATRPTGIPAGVVGAAQRGPAFVPVTVPTTQDFNQVFGGPNDYIFNGPIAASEWLRNAQSLTYLRVLGAGNALARTTDGSNSGKVVNAGFVVGSDLPQNASGGAFNDNPYAYAGGDEGRTYFLASIMKETSGSDFFSSAGLPTQGTPVVRGVVFAPSGVLLTLSSSASPWNTPASSSGTWTNAGGQVTGSVNISGSLQEFVLLLNGFKNSNEPNIISASFDVTAPNYFGKVFNTDPFKIEEKGHFLYADFPIHPALATVTGSGVVSGSTYLTEQIAFLVSSSLSRNSGSTVTPNFENFEDRYKTPKSQIGRAHV